MAHVSLYRKYRPESFDELVGQPHITTTLINAIEQQTWHHAYLFTGPRGTGKTSTARLLAMCLNATGGPTSHPDPNDPIVMSIRNGTCQDVIEIDAASNNGVDDVRELCERVVYAPSQGRLKIYIVDECHMLSDAAWNAFLKTIEEPPAHVIFIFATTEPHKVIPTVLSRTQRMDFRRVTSQVLTELCEKIADLESVAIQPEALVQIVKAGDGSVRDTLSVLDQVIAFTGNNITAEDIQTVLGTVPSDRLDRLTQFLASKSIADVLGFIQETVDAGIDLQQFATDAISHLRDLLLIATAPTGNLVRVSPERFAVLKAQSDQMGVATLLRTIQLLNDTKPRMRAGATRLPLELALVKAALPDYSSDELALNARLDQLEADFKRLGAGSFLAVEGAPSAPAATPAVAEPVTPAPADRGVVTESLPAQTTLSAPAQPEVTPVQSEVNASVPAALVVTDADVVQAGVVSESLPAQTTLSPPAQPEVSPVEPVVAKPVTPALAPTPATPQAKPAASTSKPQALGFAQNFKQAISSIGKDPQAAQSLDNLLRKTKGQTKTEAEPAEPEPGGASSLTESGVSTPVVQQTERSTAPEIADESTFNSGSVATDASFAPEMANAVEPPAPLFIDEPPAFDDAALSPEFAGSNVIDIDTLRNAQSQTPSDKPKETTGFAQSVNAFTNNAVQTPGEIAGQASGEGTGQGLHVGSSPLFTDSVQSQIANAGAPVQEGIQPPKSTHVVGVSISSLKPEELTALYQSKWPQIVTGVTNANPLMGRALGRAEPGPITHTDATVIFNNGNAKNFLEEGSNKAIVSGLMSSVFGSHLDVTFVLAEGAQPAVEMAKTSEEVELTAQQARQSEEGLILHSQQINKSAPEQQTNVTKITDEEEMSDKDIHAAAVEQIITTFNARLFREEY